MSTAEVAYKKLKKFLEKDQRFIRIFDGKPFDGDYYLLSKEDKEFVYGILEEFQRLRNGVV